MLRKFSNKKILWVVYIGLGILFIGIVLWATICSDAEGGCLNVKAESAMPLRSLSWDEVCFATTYSFDYDTEEAETEQFSETVNVDDNLIRWCDFNMQIGNVSEEERNYFTEYFQNNDGGLFLYCDYDRPQDADLTTIFYGAMTEECDEKELEELGWDYGYRSLTDVDTKLMKFIGLTNAQMTTPLFVKNRNGEDVITWMHSDWVPTSPVCRGGYKDGDTYILWMEYPESVVTLKKNEDGTLSILNNYTSVYINNMLQAYQEICTNQDVKTLSLIYFDEDSILELLLLKDGKYMLYTYNGTEAKEILLPTGEKQANAYGPRHNFENSDTLMFYWFEYVPHKGLIRVHGGDENARHDYYLKYENGTFVKELEAVSCDYVWYTYSSENEMESKAFLEQLEVLGYDELTPCRYLYDAVSSAYENINRESDTKKVLDDFASGKKDALCYVEEICENPQDGFVMRNFEEIYEEITCDEEWWGKLEYVDFDNDGEEELVLHGYCGSKSFFDVIGDTVYLLLHTSSTTDVGSVAEIDHTRVVARTDLTHGGRKSYRIMQYDSCGCLVERFCLYVEFEGERYQASDRFEYNNQTITMQEFEAMVDRIERVDTDTEKSFSSKYHIEVDDKIFFREHSSATVLEGGVLGEYSEVKEASKRLVYLDEENQVMYAFTDDGYGGIYWANDRFFSQCITDAGSRVYSCDLKGYDKKIWSSSEILDQAEDDFLICKTQENGLAVIAEDTEKVLVQGDVQYRGCFDNIIYYSIRKKGMVELYSVDIEGSQRKIATVTVKEVLEKGVYYSNDIEIGSLDVCGGYVAFNAGNYGPEGAYFGGVIVLCKQDGTDKKLFYSEQPQFHFYNKGNRLALMYKQNEKVKWESLLEKISEEVMDGFTNIPQDYVLITEHSVYGYILHENFEETYLYDYEYEELLEQINEWNGGEYDIHSIKNAEIIDNKLFFNIVLEKADPSKDIGWRGYYERVETFEYVKDLKTHEITMLYRF